MVYAKIKLNKITAINYDLEKKIGENNLSQATL